ncbi:MAG: hypothetical protein ACPLSP_01685, partial [Fervidicoccus fontis]
EARSAEVYSEVESLEITVERLRKQSESVVDQQLVELELRAELGKAREKMEAYKEEKQKLVAAIKSLEGRLRQAEEENAKGSQVLSKLLIENENLKKSYEQLRLEYERVQAQIKTEGIDDPAHPLNMKKAELKQEIKSLEKQIEEMRFELSDLKHLKRERELKEAASERACKVLHKRLGTLIESKGVIEHELKQVVEDPYGSLVRQIKKYLTVIGDIEMTLKETLTRIMGQPGDGSQYVEQS